jgi:hypothetical protein
MCMPECWTPWRPEQDDDVSAFAAVSIRISFALGCMSTDPAMQMNADIKVRLDSMLASAMSGIALRFEGGRLFARNCVENVARLIERLGYGGL